MKKILTIAALLVALPLVAQAQSDPMGGLGFRSGEALSSGPVGISTSPTIGIRQWFSSQMGVDAAIGFSTVSFESGSTTTDEATGFAFDLGLPISLKSWDKVNFIFRPGFAYQTAKTEDKTNPTPPNELKATTWAATGELEVEWMLADKLSISAAHGIAYSSIKVEDNDSPVNEAKATGFSTTGSNFTSLGFHVYLW
jgi:hypothetical protein